MATPRVLILRAPGTNCDGETAYAFQLAGAETDLVHINRLLETPTLADDYQILCLPGGFSYGDDIAAGRILASQIKHHLRDTIRQFQSADKLILGICNGFQVLIQSGVLLPPGVATLTWNDSGKFEDRWVDLQSDGNQCVFLRDIHRMYLPIAHAEGKFVVGDTKTLEDWQQEGRLALRYAHPTLERNGQLPYPLNPNGSNQDIAGVCDETGRVFGLMPHPERHIDPTHHPRWTRDEITSAGEGLKLFQNAVAYFV